MTRGIDCESRANLAHTVLVPAYNGQLHIAETLESILAQIDLTTQVIVSDDFSLDNTRSILQTFLDDERVQVYYQTRNLGLFENWNFLLGKVQTPTFTLLSQDDRFAAADALIRGLTVLRRTAHVSAVFCDLQFIDDDGAVLTRRSFSRHGLFDPGVAIRQSLILARNLFGIPLAIRSDVIRYCRFDESLKYLADLEFAFRVSCHGQPFHIPEPLLQYRIHGSNATTIKQRSMFSDLQKLSHKHALTLTPSELVAQRIFGSASYVGRAAILRFPLLRRLVFRTHRALVRRAAARTRLRESGRSP